MQLAHCASPPPPPQLPPPALRCLQPAARLCELQRCRRLYQNRELVVNTLETYTRGVPRDRLCPSSGFVACARCDELWPGDHHPKKRFLAVESSLIKSSQRNNLTTLRTVPLLPKSASGVAEAYRTLKQRGAAQILVLLCGSAAACHRPGQSLSSVATAASPTSISTMPRPRRRFSPPPQPPPAATRQSIR
jgi:hypothetical protein